MGTTNIGLYIGLAGLMMAIAYFLAKKKIKDIDTKRTLKEEESTSVKALNSMINEIEAN